MGCIIAAESNRSSKGDIIMQEVNGKNIGKEDLNQNVSAYCEQKVANAHIRPANKCTWPNVKQDHQYLEKDYFVMNAAADDKETVKQFCAAQNKKSVVPEAKQAARRQLRQDFSQKYNHAALNKAYSEAMYADARASFTRADDYDVFISLMNTETSYRAYFENKRFYDVMTKGTPEEKKEAVTRKIEELGNMDLSFIDMTDDAGFVEHFDEYRKLEPFMYGGSRLMEFAAHLGVDMKDPRFDKFHLNRQMLSAVNDIAAQKQFLISSPVYDVVDMEAMSPEQLTNLSQNVEPHFFVDIVQHSLEIANAKAPDAEAGMEISGRKLLFNTKLPPAERLAQTRQIYNDSITVAEIRQYVIPAQNREAQRQNAPAAVEEAPAEALHDTPDGYFAKAVEEAIESTADVMDGSEEQKVWKNIESILVERRLQKEYSQYVQEHGEPTPEEFERQYGEDRYKYEMAKLQNIPGITDIFDGITGEAFEQLTTRILLGETEPVDELEQKIADVEKANKELDALKNSNPNAYYEKKQAYYTDKIKKNVQKIDKIIGGFSVSPEEIEAMVSRERIDRHEKAAKLIRETEIAQKGANYLGNTHLDTIFDRIIGVLGNTDGTEQANKENAEIFSRLGGLTQESNEARRDIIIKILNETNKLQPDDLKPDVQLEQGPEETQEAFEKRKAEAVESKRFENAVEKYSAGYLGFDLAKTSGGFAGVGVEFTAEAKLKFNAQMKYLVDLGSEIRNEIDKYGNETLFTIPLDKLTDPGKVLQLGSNKEFTGINKYFTDIATKMLVQQNPQAQNAQPKPNLSGQTYTRDDIVFTKPLAERSITGFDSLRTSYREFYNKLYDADHFYNFNNSRQYKDLLGALKDADNILGKMKDDSPEKDKQKLFDALAKVNKCSNEYLSKRPEKEGDDIRNTRRDICSQILSYSDPFVVSEKLEKTTDYRKDGNFMKLLDANRNITRRKEQALAKINEGIENYRNLPDKETDAAKALGTALKRRETLRKEFIDHKTFDKNNEKGKVRYHIAAILCCEQIAAGRHDSKLLDNEGMKTIVDDLANSRSFRKMVTEMTPDKALSMLSWNSDKLIDHMESYMLEEEKERFEQLRNGDLQDALYEVNARNARNELAKMEANPESLDKEKAFRLMLKVNACEIVCPQNLGGEVKQSTVNKLVENTMKQSYVKNAAQNLTAEKINDFLAEGGTDRLDAELRNARQEAMNRRAPQNAANHARNNNAPVKDQNDLQAGF